MMAWMALEGSGMLGIYYGRIQSFHFWWLVRVRVRRNSSTEGLPFAWKHGIAPLNSIVEQFEWLGWFKAEETGSRALNKGKERNAEEEGWAFKS
jgi:hypothetical protein